MTVLSLHEFHQRSGAHFMELAECEAVAHYGDETREYESLQKTTALLDLGFRSRVCLTGADRLRFLNGQVTNNVKDLAPGTGCYATLVSGKGKLQADLNVYSLDNELLLDFEPGLTQSITERLNKYIIADDVQIVDVAPFYGLLSVQGPRSAEALRGLGHALPEKPFALIKFSEQSGDLYLVNQSRIGHPGFDIYVPNAGLEVWAEKLSSAAREAGGCVAGWNALELSRFEASIPRFPIDMDETNLPPEAGLDHRAISYSKGCYIGQEVIARIRTYGQVAKALRGLRFEEEPAEPPRKGDKLLRDGKEAGYVTSSMKSPRFHTTLAMAYVRRESNKPGTELLVQTASGPRTATVIELPFSKSLSPKP
jgi:folate-binding protein YgfZ